MRDAKQGFLLVVVQREPLRATRAFDALRDMVIAELLVVDLGSLLLALVDTCMPGAQLAIELATLEGLEASEHFRS